MQCDRGYGVRKTTEQEWQQSRSREEEKKQLMEDPKLGYVTINDLHVGKTITLRVPTKVPSSLPPSCLEKMLIPFLSQLKNSQISFNSSQSLNILPTRAKAIKRALEDCESKPIKEVKFCATSLESMADSVRAIFGSQAPFKVVSTTSFTKSNTLLQNYTFLEVKELPTSMTVACHDLPYPYAVFYCHDLGDTKVFEISLGGGREHGERVTAFFICHMDTSGFRPDHIAFRVLGFKPGAAPVCHCVFPKNLLWVRH
jgi:phosphoribosylformylglycinamidine (FGAM) synthase PurS component